METSPAFSRRFMGFDRKVWMTMLSVVIVSIGLVSYKRITDKPCVLFTISNKGLNNNNKGEFYVDEIIRFAASIAADNNITWNFGDNSAEEKGVLVSHAYTAKGKYVITAKANGKCPVITSVYIRTTQAIHTHSHNDGDTAVYDPATVIIGNETPKAGKEEVFIGNVFATSYEWTILNRNEYKKQNGKTATYTFTIQGTYTLQLRLDNNREKVYTKTIYVQPEKISEHPLKTVVLIHKNGAAKHDQTIQKKDSVTSPPVTNTIIPKPIIEETKTTRIIGLPDEAFKSFLEDVVKGGKDVNFFNKYLNNGGDTKVRVNNEPNSISFAELIQRIKGNKKISINNVKILRDPNKDVLQINIVYSKKRGGPLGWLKRGK